MSRWRAKGNEDALTGLAKVEQALPPANRPKAGAPFHNCVFYGAAASPAPGWGAVRTSSCLAAANCRRSGNRRSHKHSLVTRQTEKR